MLAVLTGGGTAGHITPALALAAELRNRGWEVRYAGTPDSAEERLVTQTDIPFMPFVASGFKRSHPTTLFTGVARIANSRGKAKKWFAEIKPDCVIAFGGYACLPCGMAATACGVPLVIHEQNSVMGWANKFLSSHAACVCLTYEHAARDVADASKVVLTGNPVRPEVVEAKREDGRKLLGVPEDATLLLVTGGSLGARHLNQALCGLKDQLLARENLYIAHVTGKGEYESVVEALALTDEEARRYLVFDYQDEMGLCMAAADAIVSRAGASSLAEIAARALPALLVPFPYAAEDHQTTNAQSYVDAGCAVMVADADVESPEFADALFKLVDDPSFRDQLSQAARAHMPEPAAKLLADEVERAAARQ